MGMEANKVEQSARGLGPNHKPALGCRWSWRARGAGVRGVASGRYVSTVKSGSPTAGCRW